MSQTKNKEKLLSAYEVPYLRPSNFTYVNHQHTILLTFKVELYIGGGMVASWLVHSTPDQVVRVLALAGVIVLCS